MELRVFAEKIKELKKSCDMFLEENEEDILKLIRKEKITAEENLQKELLFALLDAVTGVCSTIDYMKKEIVEEGTLGRNEKGEITFNEKALPLMSEIEVFVFDRELEQEVWTRVFVGGKDEHYLVGLGKDQELAGLKARMRG